jgi:hypothetical protein
LGHGWRAREPTNSSLRPRLRFRFSHQSGATPSFTSHSVNAAFAPAMTTVLIVAFESLDVIIDLQFQIRGDWHDDPMRTGSTPC